LFCSNVKLLLALESLETSVESKSGSTDHILIYFKTLSKDTIGFLSNGFVSVLSCSIAETASTITKCVFCLASGVTL